VKARGLTLVVAVAILMLVTGCSPPREIPQPTTAPPTAEQAGAPEMVLVPSLEDAIRSVDATATYEQDPQALADQFRASIERYYADRQLKANVEYQSIVLPDSQEPPAGAIVPVGTVVNLLIGFGD
jgi:hypothetical protein